MQSQQLLTESQVFEDEILPGTESADHLAEEMPERHDRGKNLIGTVRIEPFAKSFILRVYDVLARHNPTKEGGFPDPDGPAVKSSVNARADTVYELPKASITVIRGTIASSPTKTH